MVKRQKGEHLEQLHKHIFAVSILLFDVSLWLFHHLVVHMHDAWKEITRDFHTATKFIHSKSSHKPRKAWGHLCYLWNTWQFWPSAHEWRLHHTQTQSEDAAGRPTLSTCDSLPLLWLYRAQTLYENQWWGSWPENEKWSSCYCCIVSDQPTRQCITTRPFFQQHSTSITLKRLTKWWTA